MTDDTFRELTGPVNNLGSGALKVGKLQYNFEYFDGVVENQENQSLRPNSKIIQVDNIQVTGEILFKKNVLDTNGLGYGYGSQKTEVVSLSGLIKVIIKNTVNNTKNLAVFATNIATNLTSITDLTKQQDTNKSNIATNLTSITNLTTQQNTNKSNIATNLTSITDLTKQQDTNKSNIATNATNIVDITRNNTEFTGIPKFTRGFTVGGDDAATIKLLGDVKGLIIDSTHLNVTDGLVTFGASDQQDEDVISSNSENDNVKGDGEGKIYGMRVKIGGDNNYEARQLSYNKKINKWTTGLINAPGDFPTGEVKEEYFYGMKVSNIEFADPVEFADPAVPLDNLLANENDDTIRDVLNNTNLWEDGEHKAKKIQIIMDYTKKIKLCRVGDNFVLEVALNDDSNGHVDHNGMVELQYLQPHIFRLMEC